MAQWLTFWTLIWVGRWSGGHNFFPNILGQKIQPTGWASWNQHLPHWDEIHGPHSEPKSGSWLCCQPHASPTLRTHHFLSDAPSDHKLPCFGFLHVSLTYISSPPPNPVQSSWPPRPGQAPGYPYWEPHAHPSEHHMSHLEWLSIELSSLNRGLLRYLQHSRGWCKVDAQAVLAVRPPALYTEVITHLKTHFTDGRNRSSSPSS